MPMIATKHAWRKFSSLALAFAAQSHAPDLESYEIYAWRLNRTHISLVMAKASSRY